MKKIFLKRIIFLLIIPALFLVYSARADEKKEEPEKKGSGIKKGQRIGGYVGKETEEAMVSEEELEGWDKWQKGQLVIEPEALEERKKQFKALLDKWREKILPDNYVLTGVRGEVLIKHKEAKVGDKVSITRDQFVLRNFCTMELVDEETNSIKIIIKQEAYQKTRFFLADMNVPIKNADIDYDIENEMTIIDILLEQLVFELIVYEGEVHTAVEVPAPIAPAAPAVAVPAAPPAPPPIPDPEPYEG